MSSKNKKKVKYILLTWSKIPEDLEFYLIPLAELDKQKRQWLRRCHGNYINSSMTTYNGKFTEEQIDHAMMMVHEMISDPNASWLLQDKKRYFEEQAEQFKMPAKEFKSIYGFLFPYKLQIIKPKSIPKCKMVKSGIFL